MSLSLFRHPLRTAESDAHTVQNTRIVRTRPCGRSRTSGLPPPSPSPAEMQLGPAPAHNRHTHCLLHRAGHGSDSIDRRALCRRLRGRHGLGRKAGPRNESTAYPCCVRRGCRKPHGASSCGETQADLPGSTSVAKSCRTLPSISSRMGRISAAVLPAGSSSSQSR